MGNTKKVLTVGNLEIPLGLSNNIIVTGPNNSGKSVLLRSVLEDAQSKDIKHAYVTECNYQVYKDEASSETTSDIIWAGKDHNYYAEEFSDLVTRHNLDLLVVDLHDINVSEKTVEEVTRALVRIGTQCAMVTILCASVIGSKAEAMVKTVINTGCSSKIINNVSGKSGIGIKGKFMNLFSN